MSIVKRAISGALWMSGTNYLGFIVNFAIQLILVRLLMPEEFGTYTLGLSIAEILFVFFGFSFYMAIIQIQEAEDLFDTSFYLTIITGVIVFSIGVIISIIISSFYPLSAVTVLLILCAIQPIMSCANLYSAFMEKELNFRQNSLVRMIATNASGIGAVILAYMKFGMWSLVGREIIAALLMLGGMRFFSKYRLGGKFNRVTAKKLLDFTWKMLFCRGLEIIYHRVPNFFIGTFAGVKALGFFSQTCYIAGMPNTIFAPFTSNVAYAALSKIRTDKDKVNRGIYLSNYFISRLLLPLVPILFFFPEKVINILYGENWVGAASILKYFAFYALLLTMFSNAKTVCIVYNRILQICRTYLVAITVLFTGIFVALYTGKLHYVASAYSLSMVIGSLILLYFLKTEDIKSNLAKLFCYPGLMYMVLIPLWLFCIYPHVTHFSSNKLYDLSIISANYLFFLAAILVFEIRVFRENFSYLFSKFMKGN